MRLARGEEFLFDAEMHFERAALEPASAAPRQMRRLGMLPDSQDTRIEGACFSLAPGGHRKLHVIDRSDLHRRGVRFTMRFSPARVKWPDLGAPTSVVSPERRRLS